MSKGLEALKEMRKYGAVMIPNCEIIEKELKRLEELDNGPYASIHINRYNELCDKEDAFDALSKDHEKVMKELSKETEKNRVLKIIRKYGRFDNDTGDLIVHIPDGKNEDKEYELLKGVLL